MAPCFIPSASNELYPWILKILVLKDPAKNPFPIAFCLSELVSILNTHIPCIVLTYKYILLPLPF